MTRAAILAVAAVVGWNGAFLLFGETGVLVPIAVVAVVLGGAALLLGRSRWVAWGSRFGAGTVSGVALGVALAGASHLAYALAAPVLPVEQPVSALYAMLRMPPGPARGFPLMVLTIVAEELVFRGVLQDALRPRLGRWAVVGSALVYTLANLGSGTWVLPVMALLLGILWGWLAERSGGLATALWCHLIWDVLVFVVVPLA